MILERFTDENGNLHVFDARRSKATFATKPKNAFVVRDLNTIHSKDGSIDVGLEIFYSGLESMVAPIIDKIVYSAQRRILPRLTVTERNTWDNFVYHQQKRSPDLYERLDLIKEAKANFGDYLDQFERDHRALTAQERHELAQPDALERITQAAIVEARGRGSLEILTILAERGIWIAIAGQQNKSFIVGDHPQARMGANAHLSRTELWLPISADVAISPGGPAGTEQLFVLSGDQIRRVNVTIAENCSVIAGRSAALINSLSKRTGVALRG